MGKYIPLVALVAQFPALHKFLPEHAQCLPMVHVIFADTEDRTLGLLADLLLANLVVISLSAGSYLRYWQS